MTILRTQRDGVWELRSNAWGTFLAPTVDPLADTVITQEQLEGFELNPDTPKIPRQLWSRWVNLCIEMCKRGTGNLEVSCRLLRHVDDPSNYRICIPYQKVSGASVRVDSFDKAVDIETGEVIEQWPPEGWRPCGSSHSHNTMGAFFSGTDDKYELGDPGLHIVVGTIDVTTGEHTVCASITANQRRFSIDPFSVIPSDIDTEAPVPDQVYAVIDIPKNRSFSGTVITNGYTLPKAPSSFNSVKDYATKGAVSAELEAVRQALDTLVLAGEQKQLDLRGVLEDLCVEIDDLSFFTGPADQYTTIDPPMTWQDDYLL